MFTHVRAFAAHVAFAYTTPREPKFVDNFHHWLWPGKP